MASSPYRPSSTGQIVSRSGTGPAQVGSRASELNRSGLACGSAYFGVFVFTVSVCFIPLPLPTLKVYGLDSSTGML